VTAMADVIDAALDSGSTMKIYTGSAPADADTTASGTLLASIPLNFPVFGAASSGVITLDITGPPEDTSADATGTAGYARIYKVDGTTCIVQFDTVTVTAGGGEVEMNSISVTTGVSVQITGAGTITVPESD